MDSNNNDIHTTSVLQRVEPSLNEVIVRKKFNIDNNDFILTRYEKIKNEMTNVIKLDSSKIPQPSHGDNSITKLHHQKTGTTRRLDNVPFYC